METLIRIALSNAVIATLLALLAFLVSRGLRRPALAHALWLLVLVKLLTPPLIHVPLALQEETTQRQQVESDPAGGEVVFFIPVETPVAEPLRASSLSWTQILLSGWLVGSVAWVSLAIFRLRRFHLLLRFAEQPPDWLQQEVDELAHALGLRRAPRLQLIPGRLSPMLWSLGRSRLLIPKSLLPSLSTEQRRSLLLHELAHYRRGDHRTRLLEFVTMALFWWHPVVWWARRELRECEEQCCDAWVVWALPEMRKSYATALVECLDFLADSPMPLPLAASGAGQNGNLKRRLKMIMNGNTSRRLSWTGILAVLTLACLLLPVLPTVAQDKKKPVKKAPTDLDRLRAEVEKSRAALKNAEARLKAAEQKLGKGKGDKGKGVKGKVETKRAVTIVIVGPDGEKKTIHLKGDQIPPGLGKFIPGGLPEGIEKWIPKGLPKEARGKILELMKKGKFKWGEAMPPEVREMIEKSLKKGGIDIERRIEIRRGEKGGEQKRIDALEKKLNAVLKELQSLRKKLNK